MDYAILISSQLKELQEMLNIPSAIAGDCHIEFDEET